MKVKELIEQLSEMDPELEVILQKDAEGNGYSPLAGSDGDCVYEAESTYHGNVYGSEDVEDGYGEGCPKVCVLFPIN
jgi:hypothetical protein